MINVRRIIIVVLTVVAIALFLLGLFVYFNKHNERIANEEIIDVQQTHFFAELKMHRALSTEEKTQLSDEFKSVYDSFNNLEGAVTELNKSTVMDSHTKSRVNNLLTFIKAMSPTMTEIKNEIKYPAESVDEKIGGMIGHALFLKEKSKSLQIDLANNNLKRTGNALEKSSADFFDKIVIFGNKFVDAIKINDPVTELHIPEETVVLLTREHVNETLWVQYNQFDGSIFFENIKKTVAQLRMQYNK